MAFYLRAALALLPCVGAASVHAGDMCPAPPKHSAAPATPLSPDDHSIHIDSDDARIDADGHADLSGNVQVSQDGRTVSAHSVKYDYKTGKLAVNGAVDFEDPKLRIKSDTGTYDTLGGATFDKANFQVLDRNGRGYARAHRLSIGFSRLGGQAVGLILAFLYLSRRQLRGFGSFFVPLSVDCIAELPQF